MHYSFNIVYCVLSFNIVYIVYNIVFIYCVLCIVWEKEAGWGWEEGEGEAARGTDGEVYNVL